VLFLFLLKVKCVRDEQTCAKASSVVTLASSSGVTPFMLSRTWGWVSKRTRYTDKRYVYISWGLIKPLPSVSYILKALRTLASREPPAKMEMPADSSVISTVCRVQTMFVNLHPKEAQNEKHKPCRGSRPARQTDGRLPFLL